MPQISALVLGQAAVAAAACVLPTAPLSNTIPQGFGIQVQNPAFPVIHNRFMNLFQAGGGDQHLYLSPAGASAFDLTLNNGVIERGIIHAVINGEYTASDNTTKLFMTERNDPRAVFQPVYGCNPSTDTYQIELAFQQRQTSPVGGNICVRSASGDRHEFRYSPPGNPANDPSKPCMPVKLALVRQGGGGVTSVPTATTTATSTAVSTPTTTTTTSTSTTAPTATATGGPLPYTDMTARGFAFVGCSPEARRANDGGDRTLTGAKFSDDAMTNEKCLDYCNARGFRYAGTEYRRECYCGSSVAATRQPAKTLVSLNNCKLTCMGNGAQYCGGQSWLSLYEKCAPGASCVNAQFS